MIVILTQDLMMSSRASAVAKANSMSLKSIGSIAKTLDLLAEGSTTLLLVDLQIPALQLAELTTGLQSLSPDQRPHSVAYAQHVNVDLLREAKMACFDEVLTRGQVNGGLGELFSRHCQVDA